MMVLKSRCHSASKIGLPPPCLISFASITFSWRRPPTQVQSVSWTLKINFIDEHEHWAAPLLYQHNPLMLTQIWKLYIISSKIVNVFFGNRCLAFQHHKKGKYEIWKQCCLGRSPPYKAISTDKLTFVFDWWQLTLVVSHWLIIHTLVIHWSIIHLPEGQSFLLIAAGATLLGSNPCQHNSHSSNVDTNTNSCTNTKANTYLQIQI